MSLSLDSERCPKCGKENSVHLNVCHHCGKDLPWAGVTPEAAAAMVPAEELAPQKRADLLLSITALLDLGMGLLLWCGNYFDIVETPFWASYFMMILGGGVWILKEQKLDEASKPQKKLRR